MTDLAVDSGQPWERQPKESAPAWEAFVAYRDLGYRRSTAKVARALGKSKALIDGWSSRWHWVARSDAYLEHLDEQQRQLREENIRQLHDLERVLGQSALIIALQRLQGDDDANVAPLNPNHLNATEVATLLDRGSKTLRLALGEPTDLVKAALMIHVADHQRQLGAIVDVALRYIPEDEQATFLRELQAQAGGE
jgi:hypothetical protein